MFTIKRFPQQKQGEKVLIFLRRHWFVLFKGSLIYLLLLIIPIILYYFIDEINSLLKNPNYFNLAILAASIYYLFVWLFLYNGFIDYYLDVWIVTNKRVISIEQKNLFARTIAVKELRRLQDATSEIKGFLPTFLNYGDVFIQTAGEKERFIFKQVPHPSWIAQQIVELVQKEKNHKERDNL